MRSWLVLSISLAAAACGGSEDGGIPEGERLITGRALLGASSGTQRLALQVVAVYAAPACDAPAIRVGDATPDGTVAACAIFGDPFDPGEQGGGVPAEPFKILLPCELSVNLVVQTLASSDGRTPGDLVAVLAYPDGGDVTTLLPRELGSALAAACHDTELRATNLIDLGEFTLPQPASPDTIPIAIIGGTEGGTNPLATVDTDDDGDANAIDTDDDGDGTPDDLDDDDDADGAADAAQEWSPAWW
jgi:hypothetical protein